MWGNVLYIDEFFSEHRRVLEQRLAPLVREVTDARGKSREELESMYRKIVSVVLLRSGLGAPTDIGVVREATGSINTLTQYCTAIHKLCTLQFTNLTIYL